MMDKSNIDDVINFCLEHDIHNIGLQLALYEQIYKRNYDKYSNKHVACTEIFNEWKNIYRAYWDKDLKETLHKNEYKR